MKLDDAQKRTVAGWIAEGLKVAEIQSRLGREFGLALTYMDVRFLIDDLKLLPKDPEPVKVPDLPAPPAPAAPVPPVPPVPTHNLDAPGAAAGGGVAVTVDQLARPGALISGKVTFSDGQQADWSLDQMGRLALAAQQKGYRPSQADVQEFQMMLQSELARMGF